MKFKNPYSNKKVFILIIIIFLMVSGCSRNQPTEVLESFNNKVVYMGQEGLYMNTSEASKSTVIIKGGNISFPRFNSTGDQIYYMENNALNKIGTEKNGKTVIFDTVKSYSTTSTAMIYAITDQGIMSFSEIDGLKKKLVLKQEGFKENMPV